MGAMVWYFPTQRIHANLPRCCAEFIPMLPSVAGSPKRRRGLPRTTRGSVTRQLLGTSSPLLWRGNGGGMRSDRASRRVQPKRQRLLPYAPHKGSNHPSQARGNISPPRNHFPLHVNSPPPSLPPPPPLHSPT